MKHKLQYLARCFGAAALLTVMLTLVGAAAKNVVLEGWIVNYLAALSVAPVVVLAFTARPEDGGDD